MSRRTIQAINANHTVAVGYDRGMKTFFAQVVDSEIERLATEAAERVADAHSHRQEPTDADAEACERNSMIFWIGADNIGQVPTVEQLASQLAPYAVIEPEMLDQLRADQQQAEARPRTPHERAAQAFIISNARSKQPA